MAPSNRFVFAQWKWATVNIDYHIELCKHYYSVPFNFVRQKVQVRYSEDTVEIFQNNRRIASHRRNDHPGRHSTHSEHMPKSHREHLHWTPSRMINWASKIGPCTAKVLEVILNSRDFPEQGYRSCLGILRLSQTTSPQRLEAACHRSVLLGVYQYKTIASILKKHLESQPLPSVASTPQIDHENIRGSQYYN
ncbi:MAG: transposase [SAR324 cluster bacterium]|nr:transposase [SAR324 cluster bacterium]